MFVLAFLCGCFCFVFVSVFCFMFVFILLFLILFVLTITIITIIIIITDNIVLLLLLLLLLLLFWIFTFGGVGLFSFFAAWKRPRKQTEERPRKPTSHLCLVDLVVGVACFGNLMCLLWLCRAVCRFGWCIVNLRVCSCILMCFLLGISFWSLLGISFWSYLGSDFGLVVPIVLATRRVGLETLLFSVAEWYFVVMCACSLFW